MPNDMIPFCMLSKVKATIYDSVYVSVRTLPEIPSKVYKDKEFIYEEPVPEPDIFTRIINWFLTKIRDFISKFFDLNLEIQDLTFREALWVSLLVLLVILLVIGVVFFVKKLKANVARDEKVLISVEEAEKNIHEVNFDDLINNALNQKNYKLAVRFCYLKTLKLLSDKGVVDYAYQKTNYEYYYEIKEENIKGLFKEAVILFDYSWYGEYPTGEAEFQSARSKFTEIQKLTTGL